MVNSTLRRRTPIRIKSFLPAALLASLIVMPALTGCQFLGSDMFPPTLSREEAVLDLDSKLADLGVTGEYEIRRMEFVTLPVTGKKYILLLAETYGLGPRLLLLDADDLSVVNTTSSLAVAYAFGLDDQGLLCSWTNTNNIMRYYPQTQTTASFMMNYTITFETYFSTFLGSTSSSSFLLWYDPTTNLLGYNPFSAGVSFVPHWNYSLSIPSIPNIRMNSLYYEGTAIQLLFVGNNGNDSYIVKFSGLSTFATATNPIMTTPNATITTIPSGDDGSGWLTRNGAIILTHENDTRLVRYESDSGKELDSFKLNDTEDTRFTFSADGTKWLMYNGLTGKLHLLRTWW